MLVPETAFSMFFKQFLEEGTNESPVSGWQLLAKVLSLGPLMNAYPSLGSFRKVGFEFIRHVWNSPIAL